MTAIRRALVRRPTERLAEGLLTHLDRRPVDVELALRQWSGYVAALADHGWDVVEVPPAPAYPDAHFVEDTVVLFGGLAVVARPATPERLGEQVATAGVLEALGYPTAAVEGPGSLEGGDVLKVGRTVYVGRGTRTTPGAVGQLRRLLTPRGLDVVAVPCPRALHLKSALTALPDGTIVGHAPLVEDPSFFPRFVGVPDALGAQVVDLGEGRILMSAAAPDSAAMYADRGYEVIAVDISEFEKLEGCVTCLSVRVRESPGR
ncbi:dimethylargininase [Patulibacter sp. NPDC049589]|uniref:dimethylargininase n=1 Tax=Patulibacter sp. NPDC049589 TaxID=3154731 RepID=UPI00343F0D9E